MEDVVHHTVPEIANTETETAQIVPMKSRMWVVIAHTEVSTSCIEVEIVNTEVETAHIVPARIHT